MSVTELKTKHVESISEQLQEGILYVSLKFELAIHLCACGCKGQAVTPIKGQDLTGWIYREDPEGPTLSPSIGHQKWPCRSHYFVTNGKIVFCSDHGVGKEQKI